jgi:hypothetical protein
MQEKAEEYHLKKRFCHCERSVAIQIFFVILSECEKSFGFYFFSPVKKSSKKDRCCV